MNIRSIAWGIAVDRIPLPPKTNDRVVREIQLKEYTDELYVRQEDIIQNFNDVLSKMEGFVLVPKECSDEMAEVIAATARVCGGIAGDVYDAIVKQAMVEAAELRE